MKNNSNQANFTPEIPDFPNVPSFLPCYGKFDLTTYIRGASDYEIICKLVSLYNTMADGYHKVEKLSADTQKAYVQLQTWVNEWFNKLDVQQEINNKLQAMYENGTLANAIAQSNTVPGAVTQYLNTPEGTKNLSNATSQKIDSMASTGELETVINNTGTVQSATTNWLQRNVTPTGSAVMVDKTLSIEGAAADSKVVGDKISTLEDTTKSISNGDGIHPNNIGHEVIFNKLWKFINDNVNANGLIESYFDV